MRELPRNLVTILRTEARNQRTPPIDYVIAEDGGRMVHRPEPDIAMAELLEEAATALAARDAELTAVKAALSGDTGELIDMMAEAIRDWGSHYDDGPWETLPEDRKAGWRDDAERALAAVKEYLTTRALSSPDQADAGKVEGDGWHVEYEVYSEDEWQAASTDLDGALDYAVMYAADGFKNITVQEVRRRTLPSAPSEGAE
ncbi:hypothetical protein L3V16_06055 [Brucella ciceri]|uniref:hypothetical protein n=1 Tax=Brucella ciceri TaxID=391287 RepID=UPI001F133580|nr:hypothetical protein [Brucella ciceri]MCH6203402.1 hypothetical protein [Brucella ciceri]